MNGLNRPRNAQPSKGFDMEREAKKRWKKPRQQQELGLFAWIVKNSKHV